MITVLKCVLVLIAAYVVLVLLSAMGATLGSVEVSLLLILSITAMVFIVRSDRRKHAL